MPNNMQNQLSKYINIIKDLYGIHLKQVILYGSYARGDYSENSDIDIMILVDINDDEIDTLSSKLSDKTYDFNYDNNTIVMPIVKNVDHFNKWVTAYPFYKNIKKEGVSLYVA